MDQAVMLRKMKGEAVLGNGRSESPEGGSPSKIRAIAVTSGKGGVGKTNIAVNLAFFLTRLRKRTLILDADTGLANIDVILGLTPEYNLYHVLKGEKTFSEAVLKGPGGIMILPASSGITEMAELSAGQKLTLLDGLSDLRRRLDFMFIDTAAGIAGNVMYFNAAAREIIVVVSPEPTSLTDAYALIKVLYQRHAKKRFRLIVNMVKSQAEAKEVYGRLSKATDHFLNLTVNYLGHIVSDEKVTEAVRRQKAVAELFPDSPAGRCIREIAEKLAGEHPDYEDDGNISFF
ncbi:MAG: MinD/ParA family protein [Syntrophales bacterium]|jgi:flagellar biosynthesis protein FlhG|nr:MinD/ParA family protein [Syntrophales bacterium]